MSENYHGRIMNIPIAEPQRQKAMQDAPHGGSVYAYGHRDARHAAAEIAAEADARIAELEQQLAAAEANAAETERVASYYESQSVGWSKKAHELERELAAAQERERGLGELLRRYRYTDGPRYSGGCCISCGQAHYSGCSADCDIDAALAAAQKEGSDA